MKVRVAATCAVLLVTVFALASCAGTPESGGDLSAPNGGNSSSAHSATDVNNADIMFASMMIPHHDQAIEMSAILLGKEAVDARVTTLAERIEATQAPETAQMDEWLQDWGAGPLDLDGAEHGDGMMTPDEMRALEDASGVEASRLFLEQMIVHHRAAIEMARDETVHGRHSGAVTLAQAIIDTQTAEITTMEGILADL